MKQFYETYAEDEKLAPVVREFAPAAENVFKDQYILEFISGKDAKPENNLRRAQIRQKQGR